MILYLQIGLISYPDWTPGAMRGSPRKKKVDKGTEDDCIVLGDDDEGDEGVGRAAEWGGDGHPAGGPYTPLVSIASTPEVQHAIRHAVEVSEGKALCEVF